MDYALVENRWSDPVRLSAEQANQLEALGRQFASTSSESNGEPTAVNLQRVAGSHWRIRVENAVGVLASGSDRFIVGSKIPMPHLVHLLIRAGRLPPSAAATASVASADFFWELIADWYVTELEGLLRRGLRRGYREHVQELTTARGRVLAAPTVRQILRGNPQVTCRYEEYSEDIPLNRVLHEAARAVSGSPDLPRELRQRARRATIRMGSLEEMLPQDLNVVLDRSERRYQFGVTLAKDVIRSLGRAVSPGTSPTRAFLIRTPEPVEHAMRQICRTALAGKTSVEKVSLPLRGAAETLSPDLVFGESAVGDVKYKVWPGRWPRHDVYQLVAFATGFRVVEAVRVGFAESASLEASSIEIGPISVQRCDWEINPDIPPEVSEEAFGERVRAWFEFVSRSHRGHDADERVKSG